MKLIKKIKNTCRKRKNLLNEKIYIKRRALTLKKICKICKIKLPNNLKRYKNKQIQDIVLSVKQLKPDCILFCIERNIITEEELKEIRQNCFCVITPKPIEGCKNIVVDDIKATFVRIFRYIRKICNVKVISVTGSIGKTSTKDMIESVLKEKYEGKMTVSIGNSNSRSKVAYNITRLNYNDQVYLQEVGAGSGDDDIVKLSAIMLYSDIVVYTNIKDSHIEWYGSRENIAKEKFTLSDYGNKKGLALINYDDDILRNHKFKQKTLSYSLSNPNATYYAKDIKVTGEGTEFKIIDTVLNKEILVKLKVIGEHHILNSLTAYIIGTQLGVKRKSIIRGLKKYKTKGDRQNLIDIGKYKILADCYNSSYDAVKNILQTLNNIKLQNNGQKIAVIGDIFELGHLSEQIHRKLGKLLAESNIDKVIFQGEETKYSYEEYQKIKPNSLYCSSRKDLLKTITKTIKEDDLILFKASHGMHFSSIIDSLFGTEIGEVSSLGHKEYNIETKDDYIYYLYDHHATIKEYIGKEKIVKLPEKINNLPVEKLGKSVFKDNQVIQEITLSKSIVRLRGYCFQDSSIQKINFNKNLKQIGIKAFASCSKLKQITLPEGLLVIDYKAFANCINLKEIYIPESTKKISPNAFVDSDNITILCKENSYAMNYANKNNLNYKLIK